MKVILNQSYMNLGEIGDVLDVKPGYARNFLIPQGIAKRATLGNLRVLADQAKKLDAQKTQDRETAHKLLKQLEGLTIKIVKKVSEDGRLYGSVTTKEVEAAFADKGVTIDRRQIVLGQAIKMMGEYSILVKLFGGLKATVPLKVDGETAAGQPVGEAIRAEA
jgi:large subunit ribosomal protein L9